MRWLKTLFIYFLFASALNAQDVLSVSQFSGLNTDDNAALLEDGQTPDAENVVTDSGGLQGRTGFISFSTSPASDLFEFPLSNGIRYIIRRSSNTLTAALSNGQFSTLVSTVPTDRATYASVLGDRFYFMNTTDGLKYWNGATVTLASSTLKGTMIATHKGRLWVSGVSGAERLIYVSKYLDGTTWTTPANPTLDDPTQIAVQGSLDENTQALFSSFQDKIMWFKKNSFGAIFGSNRGNFIQRTFSDTIGVSAPESIRDCDGVLRWLGPDRQVWEFDGSSHYKISDQIDSLFQEISQGDSANRTAIITSQSEFEQGTSAPTGNLSTTIFPGSLVLSTMSLTYFLDNGATDYTAGTLVNIDTTTSINNIQLTLTSNSGKGSCTSGSFTSDIGSCSGPYYIFSQKFTPSTSFFARNIQLRLYRIGSPGSFKIRIMTDNAGAPGTVIDEGTIEGSTPTTDSAGGDVTTNFNSGVALTAGTAYWLQLYPTSTCSDGVNQFKAKYKTSACNAGSSLGAGVTTPFSGQEIFWQINGNAYNPTGSIVSRTFDVGFTTNTWLFNFSTFTAVFDPSSLPSGTTVTFETQSSSDAVTFNALTSVSNGSVINSTTQRFIRYKATLITTSSTTTPTVDSVKMNYGPFLKASGTYTSNLIFIGNQISQWGPVSIGDRTGGSGSIVYQFGSTSTANISSIVNWQTIVSNQIPTISTNIYVAFRSTFSAVYSSDIAHLNDLTISWIEGSSVRTASAYIDQRYWLAVTTATSNDIVYVYDKKKQWHRYRGINADCFGKYNSNVYFGNSTGIFKTNEGYSDAGSDITAYYRTKDFVPSGTDVYSKYNYIYMTTDKSDATLSSDFFTDGLSTINPLGSYQMNTKDGYNNFKIPFRQTDMQQSKFIGIRWNITGTDFWRIINANLYYNKGVVPD